MILLGSGPAFYAGSVFFYYRRLKPTVIEKNLNIFNVAVCFQLPFAFSCCWLSVAVCFQLPLAFSCRWLSVLCFQLPFAFSCRLLSVAVCFQLPFAFSCRLLSVAVGFSRRQLKWLFLNGLQPNNYFFILIVNCLSLGC